MNSNPNIQQQAPKIDLKQTNEVVCEKCSHTVFNMGVFMRKLSPFLSGTGKVTYIPIENVALYCVKCGNVNDEFVPEQLKTKLIV